jgi:hypothetical protein
VRLSKGVDGLILAKLFSAHSSPYSETFLAIIGILEALQTEGALNADGLGSCLLSGIAAVELNDTRFYRVVRLYRTGTRRVFYPVFVSH